MLCPSGARGHEAPSRGRGPSKVLEAWIRALGLEIEGSALSSKLGSEALAWKMGPPKLHPRRAGTDHQATDLKQPRLQLPQAAGTVHEELLKHGHWLWE